MENIRCQLLDILEELLSDDLNKFQWYLTNGVEGFSHIPKSLMEKAGRSDTVDTMVERCTPDGAVEITLNILNRMNQNELAEKLRTNVRESHAGGQATSTKAQHEDSTDTAAQDAQRRAESQKLKSNIIDQYAELYEGTAAKGKHNLLNDVYTELYIVKDWRGGVNTDHEVIQVEARPVRHAAPDAAVKFSEVFSGSQRVKKVLTLGIAGIGKTVSVRKFAVDWAEGESNADIDFVFIIPFRELNLLKDEEYSLPELLLYFYPEQQLLKEPGLFGGECKCVFIFDGLDEFRSPLSFGQKKISAVTEKASVNVLVTSLITGTLFPSARVWITSRPAAADQIPSNYIHLVTEVQGFVTDQQKKEYFRKRISMERKEKTSEDQDEAKLMISLIKKSKTLYIMCYIPVFCWITYTVLQHNRKNHNTEELKSLTQMYTHFLTIQMETKREKDNQTPQKDTKNLLESNRTILLKLAELAFKQLMKGNVMFYEEDLRESSIDVTEAAVYSGIFTEFFKEESEFQQRKVYSFVHLSFQEFLAAVYVFHCYENKKMEELEIFNPFKGFPQEFYDQQNRKWSENDSLYNVLKGAVDKAVKTPNGNLDLFLRFLLGISLESNRRHLQGLLTTTQCSSEQIRRYISTLIRSWALSFDDDDDPKYFISTERSINLFLCLYEMNDQSLFRELQEYLNSERHSEEKLSPGQCSALAYMLLSSEKVLDELDLKKYSTSEEGYRRLIPALTVCRKARLAGCNLTKKSCETLCSAVQSANSPLRELDLSNNDLQDSGVELLSAGLKSSDCELEALRLVTCNIGQKACENLGSALQSANSSLTKLDLRYNDLQDSGVELLSAGLMSSQCKLEKLGLVTCNIGQTACESLGSALQSANSSLKELDLSNNDLQDSGVELLSAGLRSSHCKLEKLGLSGCMVTVKGCSHLASALKSNPPYLKELDLHYNHPGDSGEKMLSELKEDPHYALEILRVDHGGMMWMKPGLKKYAVCLTLDPNTVSRNLSLSEGNRKVVRVWKNERYPNYRDQCYPGQDWRYPHHQDQHYADHPDHRDQRYPDHQDKRYPDQDQHYPLHRDHCYSDHRDQHYPHHQGQRYPDRDQHYADQHYPDHPDQRYPNYQDHNYTDHPDLRDQRYPNHPDLRDQLYPDRDQLYPDRNQRYPDHRDQRYSHHQGQHYPDRDQHYADQHYPDHPDQRYPNHPDLRDQLYPEHPDLRDQCYIDHPNQRYPNHQDQRHPDLPDHPGQRYPDHPDQHCPDHQDQRHSNLPDHSDERYPDHLDQHYLDHPDQRYSNHPDQRYPDHPDQCYTDNQDQSYPNHRDQHYPNHRNYHCPNHRDQRCPNHRDQHYPNHRDQRCPNHQYQRCPNHRDQRYPNHRDQRCPNHRDQRYPNHRDQRCPNHQDQCYPNHPDLRDKQCPVHPYLQDKRYPDLQDQYYPGHPDQRYPSHRDQRYADYPEHPDRFGYTAQVLSVESLTGRCYWEVQWSSRSVNIAVSYRGIRRTAGRPCHATYGLRKGGYASVGGNECEFGRNNQSWCLTCSHSIYFNCTVCHNNEFTVLPVPPSPFNRVGVYLDWESGTLSFYSVSPDTHTLTHLHTLTTTFTEPLYAGFGVEGSYTGPEYSRFGVVGSSVRLCEIITS